MSGRAAINRHRQRVEAAFGRVNTDTEDLEQLSDSAKYLCILVSGFIERSLVEIAMEHARRMGAPSLQRFVEIHTARFTNAKTEKVLQFVSSFDPEWRREAESILVDEYKDAFDSVVNLRNQIAHGSSVGLTYVQIKQYFMAILHVIEYLQDLCIPE
ncbi:HEPN domain-containing protein [Oceanithermus sp.]|uniref:HEPN domain-containing protein n=1 Tax=Oceanithermus sp. TaxID=2268145 RepID=UPI0033904D91